MKYQIISFLLFIITAAILRHAKDKALKLQVVKKNS